MQVYVQKHVFSLLTWFLFLATYFVSINLKLKAKFSANFG